jgi:uncharacterized protein (TIGR03437 family)
LLAFATHAAAQVITTIAGTSFTFPSQPLPATKAPLGRISNVATDTKGNVYVADFDNNLVLRIALDGTLSVVAGNGSYGFSGDGGPATSAALRLDSLFGSGVAADSVGNLYIADTLNGRIRKVSGGIITTVAGNGAYGYAGDGGPATSAALGFPEGVAVDSANNVYIADTDNIRIRKVSGGIITTVAGNGTQGFSGDGGPATSAALGFPEGVAVDSANNVYIADHANNRIRKVSGGIITTVAGNGTQGFSGDGGPATSAQLNGPFGVAVDSTGNVYIADTNNYRVRKVSGGTITTVAGNGNFGFSGDGGPATSAVLNRPHAVAVDSAGNLYIADTANGRIRRASGGIITTFGGSGGFNFSGDGGPGITASLNSPGSVVVDSAGNLFISDSGNSRVRRVSGTVTTVAGNGIPPATLFPVAIFSGDGGQATSAAIAPSGIAVDSAGTLFIADLAYFRIFKVSAGIISVIAGTGAFASFSGDGGPATSAALYGPSAVAVDSGGNLFIVDYAAHRIRKISGGIITTIAGSGPASLLFGGGFSGDAGPATSALLSVPRGVAIGPTGDVFIADTGNNRIRRVSNGIITTVAGNGVAGFSGDGGPATSAALHGPSAVAVDSAGNLFIADTGNNRIRRVLSGIITTVAGNAVAGLSGDGGPATSASLNGPLGVAVDSAGNLYIADTGNNRVREVFAGAVSYQATPANLSFSTSAGGNAPGTEIINLSSSIAGLSFSASTSATWLSIGPSSGSLPAVLQVSVNPANLAAGTYSGTVTITVPNAVPATTTVAVTLTVQPGTPATLAVDSQSVSFAATQGSGALTQQLHVSNTGGGSLSFTANVTTSSGGSWLTISPANGTATPSSPASLTVTATPGSLAPGTYSGTVTVTGAGSTINVSVTLSVSAPTALILVSQSALSFTAVAQGGVPLPQNFGILNTGQGPMSWTATATTISGGNWLQISPSNGTVQRPYLDVSLVDVSIDPSTLAAGTYYGRIQVSAVAANTPQVMTVILTVLPAGLTLGPQMFPAGLIFTEVAGVTPGSQDVQLGNPTGTVNSYQSASIGSGFSFLPANATIQPGQPTTVRVFPDFSNLSPGSIQQGTIALQFADRSPQQVINILIVVAPSGSTAAPLDSYDTEDRATAERGYQIELGPDAASGCATQALQVQYRSLQPNFTAVVGHGKAIDVQVSDGCGTLVGPGGQQAQVSAYFASESVAMTHIGGGIWQGTWKPLTAGPVLVSVTAFLAQGGNLVAGQASVLSGVVSAPAPAATTPTVTAQGVVHAASDQGGVPIAPGGLITVYGVNLADGVGQSKGLPLPQQLNGTQVLLGNQPLPILYTSAGQLNVQVPYGVPVNTQYQLTVQHGATLSVPQSLVVAQAQPGIFTVNQQGTGQGSIVKSDQVTLAQPGTPASIGETIVIYCTGLGTVTPAVKEGSPAPTTPPLSTTVNPVTVTIGGKAAQVAFAGLTPEYAGLYQLNVVVPAGITTGDAVPVVVQVAGQTSPAVTMAVR